MKNNLLKNLSACLPALSTAMVGGPSRMAFIVTAMMFSVNANAQIVYTDVNPDTVVSASSSISTINYNIDLNNDAINDYKISCVRSMTSCGPFGGRASRNYVSVYALNTNSVIAVPNSANPRAMNLNDSILSGLSLSDTGYFRYVVSGLNCGTTLGDWPNSVDRYLGLKLIVGANTYYGWVRMQVFVGNPTTCTIKDYAYNSIPNQPILAGETGTSTTAINENSFASSINLFPNPANNHLTIDLGNNNKKAEVSITDITGKIIYRTTTDDPASYKENKIEVNTSKFAEGIYIVRIQSAGFTGTKKLVVEK